MTIKAPPAASALSAEPIPSIDLVADSSTPSLRFDATVPRQLVRRVSVADVLVTDSARTGSDTFVVAAQLRPRHQFGENEQTYDFLLLEEMYRQAALLLGYRHYDVSLDLQSAILRTMKLHIADLDAMRVSSRRTEAVLSVSARPRRNIAGRIQSVAFNADIRLDGRLALDGEGQLFLLPKNVYERMRRRSGEAKYAALPPAPDHTPAPASVVGRQRARNVVITPPVLDGAGRASAELVVDPNHPCMFGQLDHIPGNIQMEGGRQLAVAEVARRLGLPADQLAVVGAVAEFVDYAELGLPSRVTVEVDDLRPDAPNGAVGSASVQVSQGGDTVSRAELQVATRL